jgi:hypothetical protein
LFESRDPQPRFRIVLGKDIQRADQPQAIWLLRPRSNRPRNHRRRTADQGDEISPLHVSSGNDDALSKEPTLALCGRAEREKWRSNAWVASTG